MADLGALPAVDALVVAHPLDIHLAHAHARAAVVAQVLVHPDGQQGQAAEQMAPRGHKKRQNARYMKTHSARMATHSRAFQLNSTPARARYSGRRASKGKPPSSVPAGQIYLQK